MPKRHQKRKKPLLRKLTPWRVSSAPDVFLNSASTSRGSFEEATADSAFPLNQYWSHPALHHYSGSLGLRAQTTLL